MTLKEREVTEINLDNVPDEMKEHSQWICWKADQRANGKIDKIPINPSNGSYAKINDPETWGQFTDAVAFYRSNRSDGIGFVFTDNDSFVGIDLDECIDPPSGEIDTRAKQIIEQIGSYSKISPSGRGIHIIVKGKLPGPGRKKGKLEIYDEKRYFTFTGNLLNGSPKTTKNRNSELCELYQQLSGKSDSRQEDHLIQKAMNAANGENFRLLWKTARRIDSSIWGAAMERMIERPPRRLPIDSHGYLTSIAYDMADEMDREREIRHNRAERNGSLKRSARSNYYSMARCQACGTEADNIVKGLECPYCGEIA
jgi:primase-polymerase (primpol)-like protein